MAGSKVPRVWFGRGPTIGFTVWVVFFVGVGIGIYELERVWSMVYLAFLSLIPAHLVLHHDVGHSIVRRVSHAAMAAVRLHLPAEGQQALENKILSHKCVQLGN
jgi:hypothetical protein